MTPPNKDWLVVQDLHRVFTCSQNLWDRLRRFPAPEIRAVDGISFKIAEKSTYALVGESGCGKSTTGRCIMRLIEPSGGHVMFGGQDVTKASPAEMRLLRRKMQIVFQDPYSSLNPRMTVRQLLMEVLTFHKIGTNRAEQHERVIELMQQTGLDESHLDRFPHEFSGGQRQRIGIARALAVEPQFIICDEPVSALDVSVQAQIINLLEDLQDARGLTYLFIAHDLGVVRHISDRIAVMYLGKIVEETHTELLFTHPHHPYTRALLASIPRLHPRQKREQAIVKGEALSEIVEAAGCSFRNRCSYAMEKCAQEPPWKEISPDHFSRCCLD